MCLSIILAKEIATDKVSVSERLSELPLVYESNEKNTGYEIKFFMTTWFPKNIL